jgi:hypothetical protein
MVYKRGHFNKHFRQRFFVLKEGVVHYYKLEDMVVDHDNMYCTESSHVRGSISCKGLKVEPMDAARHRFGDKKADRIGFHFVMTGLESVFALLPLSPRPVPNPFLPTCPPD